MRTIMLMQVMMQVIMLVQVMMKATSDGGVYDIVIPTQIKVIEKVWELEINPIIIKGEMHKTQQLLWDYIGCLHLI